MVVFLVGSERERSNFIYRQGRTRRRAGKYKILSFKTPAFRSFSLFLPVERGEKGATVKSNHLLAYAQKIAQDGP